ncbi:putative damage-inducible protein DinB [Mesorhizobium sp. J18]|uniref:DinB family protein n=1 Tax=Mesorhizobium sp. J18 TaxID=935263 RepID=UPI00119A0D81|nr:DinB family protein [Mesorhizobium sp. J18]TWG93760.1 putative damage-inducible protein DinB [Mesorhizobium sp. J18]
MKEHFKMMAAYNTWANRRIYDAAAGLSDEECGRDVGTFFRSMMGTLNHILVADRIWMKRFTGEGDAPTRLDAILHPDLSALRSAREKEDQRIASWIEGLEESTLAGSIAYTTVTNSQRVSQRLAPTLSHFFNHQTHHRGQAHMILSVLGKEPPSLDLAYFQRMPEGQDFA